MKVAVTVTEAVTELVPAGVTYDFISIEHRAGDSINVDFVDGGTGLTDANGLRYGAGEKVITLWNSVNPQSPIFTSGIHAVCAAGETATVVVQYA